MKGFTLVEAMVSISILLVGVTGAMTLASSSIATAAYTRDKLTASMLAQEAIETVQAQRDSNFLAMSQSTIANRSGKRFYTNLITGTTPCADASLDTDYFAAEYNSTTAARTLKEINEESSSAALAHSYARIYEVSVGGKIFYWQGETVPGGAVVTRFRRFITVTETTHCGPNGDALQEMYVTATVSWTNKKGDTQSLDVKTTMYNWFPYILQQP